VPSGTGRATAQQAGKGLAGDVTLEVAQDLYFGPPLGGASGYIVLSGLVAVHADQGDAPQGAVGVAVAAGAQPVPLPIILYTVIAIHLGLLIVGLTVFRYRFM
jgi:hypothetical protein